MILLDTHAWLWWVTNNQNELSQSLYERIKKAVEPVAVASVSCLEVALLHQKGRIQIAGDLASWFAMALNESGIQMLHLTPVIAARSVGLPPIHKDPIDRVIIATALDQCAALVTKDSKISMYPDVQVVWE